MSYLIVIPAYNEEAYLPLLLKDLTTITRDIVVIDDGSGDGTGACAEAAGVAVITQPHRGKGGALRSGFHYALEHGYDWVITMDSDGQHDWRDVPRFLKAMSMNGKTPDVIVGSRMGEAAGMPFVRRATNMFMSRLLSTVIGSRIEDTQCGFRAINAKVLRRLSLETSHYDTESELLIKSGKAGCRISSIPIKTIYNGAPSNINKFTDTARFIRLLWKTL
ncbi:MAG: glycosyltransferase family 2 protein [Deltaproteobacteria bacterium]|nr:glycosyltransferase family 2 protein [Deltaproteobacteria bacterium]